jgi:EAL domain-containing protein (putative c-di-GMP-specific phosphodiesterase class I)
VLTLLGAWTGCLLLGGSHSVGPHLFYVPISLAAVRFAWPSTAAVAIVAGLLAGPMLPAEVSSNLAQEPGAWLLRLTLFVMIGVLVSLLAAAPEATLRSRLHDTVESARLLRALRAGEIEVFYQPISRLQNGAPAGFEALVRWRRSTGEYVNPGEFLPTAERIGTVKHLDRHVLRTAISEARRWPSAAQPLYVSVNLSATTLVEPDLVADIDRMLADVGLPADRLQIEITESALIDDLPDAIRQITDLRARGVTVAIDDFGSGRASLNYLRDLPVDVVKIDRSMVTAAASSIRGRRLLEGVTHMCDLLGLQIIAEGVESMDQRTCLTEVGIPMAQGFLLGRPAPAGEAHALILMSAAR